MARNIRIHKTVVSKDDFDKVVDTSFTTFKNQEVEEDEGDSVVEAEAEKDDDKEYRAMFWVFFPEVRDILHRAFASNNKNMSKPISFDHLINSRRFSGTIYKEANVFQDRDVRKYIGPNSLMQLLESQRIKEKIRNLEQDMWSY